MKKFYLFFIFIIISSCSSNILKDISYDNSSNQESFRDVFIIVKSNGFKSQDKYYQSLIDLLSLELKKRGVDASGFVYDEKMINGTEILRQKVESFNPKYIMECRFNNYFSISIKNVETEDEVWKAFLGNPFVGSKKLSQAIIQELTKQKIIKN